MKKLAVLFLPFLCSCATQQPAQETIASATIKGPTRGFEIPLSQKIKSNIAFIVPLDWTRNDPSEYMVTLFPDGTVRDIQLRSSSGLTSFDAAVRQAIEKSQPYYLATITSSPPHFFLSSRPLDRERSEDAVQNRAENEPNRSKSKQAQLSSMENGYAKYYQKVREKIEKLGTLSFPVYNGKKLYGEMIVAIPIYQDGSIYQKDGGARIERTSGNQNLDAVALEIVRQAAPFEPIPTSMRSPDKDDVWEIVTRFKFENANKPESPLLEMSIYQKSNAVLRVEAP